MEYLVASGSAAQNAGRPSIVAGFVE